MSSLSDHLGVECWRFFSPDRFQLVSNSGREPDIDELAPRHADLFKSDTGTDLKPAGGTDSGKVHICMHRILVSQRTSEKRMDLWC
jgi:hypothetical protein